MEPLWYKSQFSSVQLSPVVDLVVGQIQGSGVKTWPSITNKKEAKIQTRTKPTNLNIWCLPVCHTCCRVSTVGRLSKSFPFTYSRTTGVVEAPQMTSQSVSSIFVVVVVFHCPLGLGDLQNCPFPDVVFPPSRFSVSLFTMVRRSSCGPIACWILAQTSSLVTWSEVRMLSKCQFQKVLPRLNLSSILYSAHTAAKVIDWNADALYAWAISAFHSILQTANTVTPSCTHT